jgi:lipopolysaccharide export system protein LptA
MKKICLLAFAAWSGLNAPAQTNAVPAAAPRATTLIQSDGPADFDLNAHTVIYRDHVRVDDPQMKLRCDWLQADLPQAGGHINNIVAETNVVIDTVDSSGKPMHATSEKAVYFYGVQNGETNETLTLTGNPQVVNSYGPQSGDVIVWDRAKNQIHITNPRISLDRNLDGMTAGTNAPAANTNPPPGVIDNIDKNLHTPTGGRAGGF